MIKKVMKYNFICFLFCIFSYVHATPSQDTNNTKLYEYLVAEKKELEQEIKVLHRLTQPKSESEYILQLQNNKSRKILNQAIIENLKNFLLNQSEIKYNATLKIKNLQENQNTSTDLLYEKVVIDKMNARNEVNKKMTDLLQQTLVLAQTYQQLLDDQADMLTIWRANLLMNRKIDAIKVQENAMQQRLNQLLEKGMRLHQTLLSTALPKDVNDNKIYLLINEQQINLVQYQLSELAMEKRLAKTDYLLLINPDLKTLQTVTDLYQRTVKQLQDISLALKKMHTIISKISDKTTDPTVLSALKVFTKELQDKIAQIDIQEQLLEEDLENQKKALKKQLATRHSLFENQVNTWPDLLLLMSKIPIQLYQYVKNITFLLYDNHQLLSYFSLFLFWGSLCLMIFLYFFVARFLKKMAQDKERQRLSGHLYDGFFYLIRKNFTAIAVFITLITSLHLHHIPFSNYQLLFNLVLIGLFFRTLVLIVRRSLLERLTDVSGQDVRLYHRLKWLILTGGGSVAFLLISHLLPLPSTLQDIFSRLFMLFLMILAVAILRSHDVITHILHPFLKNKKRYVKRITLILIILIPLTLFMTAVIGIVGYINLAWTMSKYQIQLLTLLACFVLVRGVLLDFFELVSESMVAHLKTGWLWTEVILKPLDKLCRFGLLLVVLYLGVSVFDLQNDPNNTKNLMDLLVYPLVNLSGVHITLLSIMEFIAVLLLFLWLSRWTREFSYRWLYRNTDDPGIRNSLSVFTQYGVILIGTLITLRILGLDFTGMSMILGGLAVGMGFGLRDFASNIIGGLMLLIERPVREGDLITIDNYEGRVAHIGIRAMRVSSWDNMEVLIPNAETFNKPFTNWTHQDSIVRTVVPIKVSRQDCPVLVQNLIQEVLDNTPEILKEPISQIFLKQIDEALIEFEARYFINVALHTRFEVRSKVLFSLISSFKNAGIRPPIPPLSIEII